MFQQTRFTWSFNSPHWDSGLRFYFDYHYASVEVDRHRHQPILYAFCLLKKTGLWSKILDQHTEVVYVYRYQLQFLNYQSLLMESMLNKPLQGSKETLHIFHMLALMICQKHPIDSLRCESAHAIHLLELPR